MEQLRRPQAVGAFPLPAGFLLIPATDTADDARIALVAGHLPEVWPAELHGHELAHASDVDGALAAFDGDGIVDRFDRFVLAPDGVDTDSLRADLPADIAPLVDVIRFSVGLTDDPPELGDAYAEIEAVCSPPAQVCSSTADKPVKRPMPSGKPPPWPKP